MKELHSQGRTIEEIADSLKRAPLHPQIITAIKSTYDLGWVIFNNSTFFLNSLDFGRVLLSWNNIF